MTSGEQPTLDAAFGQGDRLLLQQLLTRRAISARRSIRIPPEGADPDDSSATEPAQSDIELPARWRLIPEGATLYEWQRECLPLWLASGRGTVKVATGGGKTLFALAVAQALQNEREPDLRLVIVVPTIPLMLQWRDELQNGNLPSSSIGLMGGGQELAPASDLRILICVLNSARERLPGFVAKADWGRRMLLVVDECHRANAEQAQRIFETNPNYTLGLSATPEQDSEAEGLPADQAYESGAVGRALGPIIYNFTIKQSLAAGLLTPFEVWHIGLSLTDDEGAEHARLSREISELRKELQVRHGRSRSKQGFLAWCQTQASRSESGAEAQRFIGLANRRKRLLYRAKARTDAVLGILLESVSDPEGRSIVFHESIDEIETLFLQAVAMNIPVVLEHSQLPDTLRAENIDAFRRGIARAIISAKSLVEGFNVPSADLGIIAASSGSVRQRIQSLGRMLRRKAQGRNAQIVVLYIRDTEDEAIYEKADWETIVGAERNRYFYWREDQNVAAWPSGLEEVANPPRAYKPPSFEVDSATLRFGDLYPGQTTGIDLRVDQSGNLRGPDGALVPVHQELIDGILQYNFGRRARRAPAGHLIVRADARAAKEADWRFLGNVELPGELGDSPAIRYRLKSVSGKPVIARAGQATKGLVSFALGPDRSRTPEAGQARDKLLSWTQKIGAERAIAVREIFWDGEAQYWLEIGGERILYPGPLAPLEFEG